MNEISTELLRSHRRRRTRTIIGKVCFWVFLVIVLLFTLFPFIWMVLAAFKTNSQITDPAQLFHFKPYFGNFRTVFERYDFVKPILNSFIVAVVSTALGLVLGLPPPTPSPAATASARRTPFWWCASSPASPSCCPGISSSAVSASPIPISA